MMTGLSSAVPLQEDPQSVQQRKQQQIMLLTIAGIVLLGFLLFSGGSKK
jgi:hypothetical protein